MKNIGLWLIALGILLVAMAPGFAQAQKATSHAATASSAVNSNPADDDLVQLNNDVQRLKVLVNQMRTNMAFVQSSQTPLKQQFSLEADAWQVVISQMERRIQRMEDRQRVTQPRP
jgi:TolA-binding protein